MAHHEHKCFHLCPPFCSSEGHDHQLPHPRLLFQCYLLAWHLLEEAVSQGRGDRGRECGTGMWLNFVVGGS